MSLLMLITLNKLTEDKVYQKEYSDFVSSMSYAKNSEVMIFSDNKVQEKYILDKFSQFVKYR